MDQAFDRGSSSARQQYSHHMQTNNLVSEPFKYSEGINNGIGMNANHIHANENSSYFPDGIGSTNTNRSSDRHRHDLQRSTPNNDKNTYNGLSQQQNQQLNHLSSSSSSHHGNGNYSYGNNSNITNNLQHPDFPPSVYEEFQNLHRQQRQQLNYVQERIGLNINTPSDTSSNIINPAIVQSSINKQQSTITSNGMPISNIMKHRDNNNGTATSIHSNRSDGVDMNYNPSSNVRRQAMLNGHDQSLNQQQAQIFLSGAQLAELDRNVETFRTSLSKTCVGSWRNNNIDFQYRRSIILRIASMIQRKQEKDEDKIVNTPVPYLAKKLEECLYRTAETKHDYVDVNTLKERLGRIIQSGKSQRTGQQVQRNNSVVGPQHLIMPDSGRGHQSINSTSQQQHRSSTSPSLASNNDMNMPYMSLGSNMRSSKSNITENTDLNYHRNNLEANRNSYTLAGNTSSDILARLTNFGNNARNSSLENNQGHRLNYSSHYDGLDTSALSHAQLNEKEKARLFMEKIGRTTMRADSNDNIDEQRSFKESNHKSSMAASIGRTYSEQMSISKLKQRDNNLNSSRNNNEFFSNDRAEHVDEMVSRNEKQLYQMQQKSVNVTNGKQCIPIIEASQLDSLTSEEAHQIMSRQTTQPLPLRPMPRMSKSTVQQQQHRLLLLRHSSKCEKGRSCRIRSCFRMNALWKHLQNCSNPNCTVSHCISSRSIIDHYTQCKESGSFLVCDVCAPIASGLEIERNITPENNDYVIPNALASDSSINVVQNRREKTQFCDNFSRNSSVLNQPSPHFSSEVSQVQRNSISDEHKSQPRYDSLRNQENNISQLNNYDKNETIVQPQKDKTNDIFSGKRVRDRRGLDPQVDKRAKTVNVIRNYEEGKENDISRKEDKNGSTDIKHDSVISSCNITTLFLPIVTTLKENPDFGWIFADPVDPEELGIPDYFNVIKSPMDLNSIKSRLENNLYKHPLQVEQDIRLVFENAILYNGENSEVGSMAKAALQNFQSLYNSYRIPERIRDRSNSKYRVNQEDESLLTSFTVTKIPHNELSKRLEICVRKRLEQFCSTTHNKFPEEVFVRVLTKSSSSFTVKQNALNTFPKYPREFPVDKECVALFQTIEGTDVLIFCMFLDKYGNSCPLPNKGRVFVSFMDSIPFFQPPQYGYLAQKSLFCEYISFAKEIGFHSIHLWNYSSSEDDSTFYDTPSEKNKLMNKDFLYAAKDEGIVLDIETLHDHVFGDLNGSDEEITVNLACIPYFDGDYVPDQIEDLLSSNNERSPSKNLIEDLEKDLVKAGEKLLVALLSSRETTKANDQPDQAHSVQAEEPDVSSARLSYASLCDMITEDDDSQMLKNDDEKLKAQSKNIFWSKFHFHYFCEKNKFQFNNLHNAKLSTMMILKEFCSDSKEKQIFDKKDISIIYKKKNMCTNRRRQLHNESLK